jgi:hypothetical protein
MPNPLYNARNDPDDLRIEELFDANEYLWVDSLNCTPVDSADGAECSAVIVRLRILEQDGCWATRPLVLSPRQVAVLLMYANFLHDPDERDRLASKYDISQFLPAQDDRADRYIEEMNKAVKCKCGKRHNWWTFGAGPF